MNYKKILVIAIIAGTLLSSIDANAQKRGKKRPSKGKRGKTEQPFSIGAMAGLNLSNSNMLESKMGAGFHLGAIGEYKLGQKFSLSASLQYSMQNWQAADFGGISLDVPEEGVGMSMLTTKELKIALHSVNIPVMAKFYIIPNLFLEAGVQFGLNLSATSDSKITVTMPPNPLNPNSGTTVTTESKETMPSASYRMFELATGGGIGYNFDKLTVSARYMVGVTPFIPSVGGITMSALGSSISVPKVAAVQRSNIQVSVAYRF